MMKRWNPATRLAPLVLLLLLAVMPARAQWPVKMMPAEPVEQDSVTDSLRLVIYDCAEASNPMPFTAVEVAHRRNGVVLATHLRLADVDARVGFELTNLMAGDSACVTILPPGWSQRDPHHRYRYVGGGSASGAKGAVVSRVGVWDVGQSLVAGCFDEHFFDLVEVILCRYRPSQQ